MGANEAVDRSKVIRGMIYDGYGYSMGLGHVLNFLRDPAFDAFLEKGRWVENQFDGEVDADEQPIEIDASATAHPLDGALNEEDMENLLMQAAEEAEKAEMTSSTSKNVSASAGAAHPAAMPQKKATAKRKVLGSLQPQAKLGFPAAREEKE